MGLKEKICLLLEISLADFKKNPDNYIMKDYPIEYKVGNTVKKGKIIQKYNAQSNPDKIFLYSDTDKKITTCKFNQLVKINHHTING